MRTSPHTVRQRTERANESLAQLVTLETAALLEQLAENTCLLVINSIGTVTAHSWRRDIESAHALAARIRSHCLRYE